MQFGGGNAHAFQFPCHVFRRVPGATKDQDPIPFGFMRFQQATQDLRPIGFGHLNRLQLNGGGRSDLVHLCLLLRKRRMTIQSFLQRGGNLVIFFRDTIGLTTGYPQQERRVVVVGFHSLRGAESSQHTIDTGFNGFGKGGGKEPGGQWNIVVVVGTGLCQKIHQGIHFSFKGSGEQSIRFVHHQIFEILDQMGQTIVIGVHGRTTTCDGSSTSSG
mmetsp:Transcript_28595/g.59737  ORF Transcript_28595/g.59737 Transcript_28595/m.59737 type:complete len:216 (-) Transcript_28595:1572-2219(-)